MAINDNDPSSGKKSGIAQDTDLEELLSHNRTTASPFVIRKCEANAAANWDKFYKRHEDRFFHNRHWTSREFQALKDVSNPSSSLSNSTKGSKEEGEEELGTEETQALVSGVLLAATQSSSSQLDSATSASSAPSPPSPAASPPVLLEVGCGVGNLLYPLLETIPDLKVHCCDFSPQAVDLVKRHPAYDAGRVNAFVFDLTHTVSKTETETELETETGTDSGTGVASQEDEGQNGRAESLVSMVHSHPFGPPSLISLIFVLSAIPPSHHLKVLCSLFTLLRPGGTLLFRDYARGDLAQLRFHSKERWAEPCLLSGEHDYYKRGDGTMTFFFGEEYVQGLSQQVEATLRAADGETVVQSEEIKVVERIGLNRKRGIRLERRFIQGVWRKKG